MALNDQKANYALEPYWIVLHDRIVSAISSPVLSSEAEWVGYPFQLLDFTACHRSYSEMHCSYVLALTHAVWHHSSIGQLSLIPKFLSEVLKPIVKTEFQLLYVYHLVGPFLQRFQQERTRCTLEVERIICSLRPAMRLRFITHGSKMEPAAVAASTSVPQSSSVSSPWSRAEPGPPVLLCLWPSEHLRPLDTQLLLSGPAEVM